MVNFYAAHHCSPNVLPVIVWENENLRRKQEFPTSLSKEIGQTFGSGYKIGLRPSVFGVRVVQFQVQFVSKSAAILRKHDGIALLEVELCNAKLAQGGIVRKEGGYILWLPSPSVGHGRPMLRDREARVRGWCMGRKILRGRSHFRTPSA